MAKKRDQEDLKKEEPMEMSLEQAKAFRASLYKPEKKSLSESERRDAFRIFWAAEKQKYGRAKNLEQILWAHLKATNLDSPEKFEEGVEHFGLKKVR